MGVKNNVDFTFKLIALLRTPDDFFLRRFEGIKIYLFFSRFTRFAK
jgi:hypothetical protein